MKTKEEKALLYFNSGLNCAQSVLSTYTEELKIDPETAVGVACGFGGGMGRLQETCGAVTGAFMVLGINNCKKSTDIEERKEKTYAMIQEFRDKFTAIHGTMSCRALLNCDIRTEEGRRYARDNKLFEQICEKCISDSLRIVEKLIGY